MFVVPTRREIANRIIAEATKYIGVREIGGPNQGPEVELFQSFVDGKAQGESWCMAFVQFVVGEVCKYYGVKTPLHSSELCQSVYNNTGLAYRSSSPGAGYVFIHQNRKVSYKGHTGVCTGEARVGIFKTIEGNTNGAGSSDGDGVYSKWRYTKGNASNKVRGFIDVPRMIQDAIELKYL